MYAADINTIFILPICIHDWTNAPFWLGNILDFFIYHFYFSYIHDKRTRVCRYLYIQKLIFEKHFLRLFMLKQKMNGRQYVGHNKFLLYHISNTFTEVLCYTTKSEHKQIFNSIYENLYFFLWISYSF